LVPQPVINNDSPRTGNNLAVFISSSPIVY
jgi:hypothetical protein